MPPRKSDANKTATKTGAKPKSDIKRPMSAFFQFLGERRSKLIAEKPELRSRVKDVGKILGDEWKGMTDAQKAPFVKKHQDDKKRYEAEKAKQAA